MRLVGIGLVAGLFSALFGVGGGIVALAGAIAYAVEGHVHVGYAALVGLPAAAGAVAGTALQQRLSGSSIVLGFAILLACVGVWLLAG